MESMQPVSKKVTKPREPLPIKYTLSIDIFVGKTCVYTQTILQTARAFDYTRFMSIEYYKLYAAETIKYIIPPLPLPSPSPTLLNVCDSFGSDLALCHQKHLRQSLKMLENLYVV
jgi:hypothetical protein